MRRRRQHGLYRRAGIFNFRYKTKDGLWREKSTDIYPVRAEITDANGKFGKSILALNTFSSVDT